MWMLFVFPLPLEWVRKENNIVIKVTPNYLSLYIQVNVFLNPHYWSLFFFFFHSFLSLSLKIERTLFAMVVIKMENKRLLNSQPCEIYNTSPPSKVQRPLKKRWSKKCKSQRWWITTKKKMFSEQNCVVSLLNSQWLT